VTTASAFPGGLAPALTTGLAVVCLPMAYQKLRREYRLPEPATMPAIAPQYAPETVRLPASASGEAGPEPAEFAEVKQRIRTRQFLAGANWNEPGSPQQWAGRWLNARERLMMEFLSAGKINWTAGLKGFLVFAICLAILFWVFPAFMPMAGVFTIVFYFFVMQGGQTWRGTALVNLGGSSSSFCSLYPVGFREITRVTLKRNLMRQVIVPVLAAIAFALMFFRLGMSADATLTIELKIIGLLLALQPVWALAPLSSGTNDTSKALPVLISISGIPVLLVCAVGVFIVDSWWVALGLLLVFGSICAGALWVYGYAYNHNWFDLLRRVEVGKGGTPIYTIRFGRPEN
jgi:hypothetical protein